MATLQYIGARYVPKLMGEWDATVAYEPLSMVTYQNGSYLSSQSVPTGTLPTNTTYWQNNGNRDVYIQQLQNAVADAEQDIASNEENIEELDARVTTLENSGGSSGNEKWLALIYSPSVSTPITKTSGNVTIKISNAYSTWGSFTKDADFSNYENVILLGNYDSTTSTELPKFFNNQVSDKNFYWGVSYMDDADNWDNASTDVQLDYRLTSGDLTEYYPTFIKDSWGLFYLNTDIEQVVSSVVNWITGVVNTKDVGYPLRMTETYVPLSGGSFTGNIKVAYVGCGIFSASVYLSASSAVTIGTTASTFQLASNTPKFIYGLLMNVLALGASASAQSNVISMSLVKRSGVMYISMVAPSYSVSTKEIGGIVNLPLNVSYLY